MANTNSIFEHMRTSHKDKYFQRWCTVAHHFLANDSNTLAKVKLLVFVLLMVATIGGYTSVSLFVENYMTQSTFDVGRLIAGMLGAWLAGKCHLVLAVFEFDKDLRLQVGQTDNIEQEYLNVIKLYRDELGSQLDDTDLK